MPTTRGVTPTKQHIWLRMQGLNPNNLPRTSTWYTKDGRECEGKMDTYNIDLYRSKGYVLDKKYRHRITWYALEYGGHEWLDEQLRKDFNAIGTPDITGQKDTPEDVPALATAVLGFMEGRDNFEGTASLLLEKLPGKVGVPRTPIKLSAEIIQPRVTDVLESNGIEVTRYRTAKERILLITRTS